MYLHNAVSAAATVVNAVRCMCAHEAALLLLLLCCSSRRLIMYVQGAVHKIALCSHTALYCNSTVSTRYEAACGV
jgi:hypothetical protein